MSGEGLSEAEREALKVACGWMRNRNVETVEAILAAYTADLTTRLTARLDYWKGRAEAAWEREDYMFGVNLELSDAKARLAAVEAERDSAQEHMAYHLRDFRPGADMAATGDLAVDMAHYADRLRARLAAVEGLVGRVLGEGRVRHDHAYPMEIGPHHCDGCDLDSDLRAALATQPAPGHETGIEAPVSDAGGEVVPESPEGDARPADRHKGDE